MSHSDNFFTEAIDTVTNLTNTLTTEAKKFLEQTTVSTGQTLDWIASNPILKSADNIIGLDWIMTFWVKQIPLKYSLDRKSVV